MKLEIFDLRTQQWSDLVPGKVPGSVVNWAYSPDYQYVYYTTGGAEPKAMRIRLADHNVETIASVKELRRTLGQTKIRKSASPQTVQRSSLATSAPRKFTRSR